MATLTTAEVAAELNTTARTLRKFLRADARANNKADTLPGKGSRYAIDRKAIAPMKKRFAKWAEAEAKARADRAAKVAEEAAATAAEVEGTEEVDTDTE